MIYFCRVLQRRSQVIGSSGLFGGVYCVMLLYTFNLTFLFAFLYRSSLLGQSAYESWSMSRDKNAANASNDFYSYESATYIVHKA